MKEQKPKEEELKKEVEQVELLDEEVVDPDNPKYPKKKG